MGCPSLTSLIIQKGPLGMENIPKTQRRHVLHDPDNYSWERPLLTEGCSQRSMRNGIKENWVCGDMWSGRWEGRTSLGQGAGHRQLTSPQTLGQGLLLVIEQGPEESKEQA